MIEMLGKLAPRRQVRRGRRGRRGMSLVEVMVVIAIIATIMGVIGFGVLTAFGNSKVDTTKLTMTRVAEQITIFELRKKKAPSTSDGLSAVFGNETVPKDSWNNEFIYVSPGPDGLAYDLISLGADGQEGGTGNDEDIRWSEIKNQ